ncbi:MAG: DUF5723 family protein [Elusimicrobiota bacterium]|jgi:hypothetical protein|nr:DUF5723 family protein [Elusimicrobiota bacterium]
MNKMLILAFGFMFLTANVFVAVKDDRIAVKGIRPMGMGGAFVAVSDDENAVFYNPAGITQRKSWLLGIFSLGAAINTETISVVSDAMDVLDDKGNGSGGDDGLSVASLEKAKAKISGKDIDATINLPNFSFISSPINIGKNSFSFGLVNFIYADIGANLKIDLPQYAFELAKIVEKNPSDFSDKDIVAALPPDILKELGSDLPIEQLIQDLHRIEQGGAAAQTALDEILDSLDQDARDLITALESGDKSFEDVINEFENKLGEDLMNKILGDIGATIAIKTYITETFNAPLAYKFTDLSTIKLPGEMSVGINLKYIYRIKAVETISLNAKAFSELEDSFDSLNLAVLSGSGFGIDLGTIYHWTPEWNFGLQISDIFTRINYNNVYLKYPETLQDSAFTESAYISPQFNIGAAYVPENIYKWKTNNRFTFALDMRDIFGAYENEFGNKIHLGAEYRLSPFALRLGLNKFRPSFGFGIELGGFQLMYAFYGDQSQLGRQLGMDKTVYYHEFLLAVKLGHHDGRPFGEDANPEYLAKEKAKSDEEARIAAEKQAEKARIQAEKAAEKGKLSAMTPEEKKAYLDQKALDEKAAKEAQKAKIAAEKQALKEKAAAEKQAKAEEKAKLDAQKQAAKEAAATTPSVK